MPKKLKIFSLIIHKVLEIFKKSKNFLNTGTTHEKFYGRPKLKEQK